MADTERADANATIAALVEAAIADLDDANEVILGLCDFLEVLQDDLHRDHDGERDGCDVYPCDIIRAKVRKARG